MRVVPPCLATLTGVPRGRGVIQRYIAYIVDVRYSDQLLPLGVLAGVYARQAGVADTAHLRSSFRGAATRLANEGVVQLYEVWAPTRVHADATYGQYRWHLCVAHLGLDLTDDDVTHQAITAICHELAYRTRRSFDDALGVG